MYHFPSTSDSLFKPFIDCFLKIKQESSGWPIECRTDGEKENYIRLYEEKEGIKLEKKDIEKNPGKRQVAKLVVNSLWGRYVFKSFRKKKFFFSIITFICLFNFV